MANNTENSVTHFVSLDIAEKDLLGNIRLWDNVKIGHLDATIWLKDLTKEQVKSIEVKSIPSHRAYYQKDNYLFLVDSLLPAQNTPSALWTPIARAISVSMPKYNDNFFTLGEQSISIKLVKSDKEREADALIVSLTDLSSYIQTASAIRFKQLKWCILDKNKALLIGNPLLPINGVALWQHKQFLFPVGYTINYPILLNAMSATQSKNFTYWTLNDGRIEIREDQLANLSIASFRRTIQNENLTL